MRRWSIALVACILVAAVPCQAQFPQAVNPLSANTPPSNHAADVFAKVMRVLDVATGEIDIAANPYVPNAMALIVNDYVGQDVFGRPILRVQKMVLYNPMFMSQLELMAGSEWAGISVIAHEVGHHLGRHAIANTPWGVIAHPWERELEADYYSGLAMARMGATPADLQRAQRLMFAMWGSPSHPDTVRRIKSIHEGWIAGGGSGDIETDLAALWKSVQSELGRWY